MTDYDAIIIGGGHNGLVAAAYLAQAGQAVLVLERRDMVGGACVTEELFPGYRVSSCAYICHLLQAKVIDDLRLREHGFAVYQLEPARIQPYPDGNVLVFWDDVERTAEGALPAPWRQTVTFDNGTEFARHHELHALGLETFCCDTHAPWQNGGVENASGRQRRGLPRKTALATGSGTRFTEVVPLYNNTPPQGSGLPAARGSLLARRVALPM